MATTPVIKVSKGLDRAPTKRAVEDIAMFESPDVGTEIKGGAWEDALCKVSVQVRVRLPELLKVILEVSICVGGPKLK